MGSKTKPDTFVSGFFVVFILSEKLIRNYRSEIEKPNRGDKCPAEMLDFIYKVIKILLTKK
jgi:hypothetical protein